MIRLFVIFEALFLARVARRAHAGIVPIAGRACISMSISSSGGGGVTFLSAVSAVRISDQRLADDLAEFSTSLLAIRHPGAKLLLSEKTEADRSEQLAVGHVHDFTSMRMILRSPRNDHPGNALQSLSPRSGADCLPYSSFRRIVCDAIICACPWAAREHVVRGVMIPTSASDVEFVVASST